MIFILNKEYVAWEVVELTRLHICEILRVPTTKIHAKIDVSDGKLIPEFQVEADELVDEGIDVDKIREVIKHAYLECKEEMCVRLHGITKTRADVMKDIDESRQAASQL